MNQFQGCFELIEKYGVDAEGERIYPWGKDVKGILTYDHPYFSAQLGIANRDKSEQSDFRATNANEAQNMIREYIAYFGKYEVKRDYILHIVEQSLFPNWIGKKLKRFYRFEGDYLYLEAIELTKDTGLKKTVLKWKRLHRQLK